MRQVLKKNGGVGIIGIVVVLLNFFLVYLNPEYDVGDCIDFMVQDAALPDLLDATGKNVVPVEIKSPGVIRHGGRLELIGGLDFDARVGDVLIFRKEKDDRWTELVGRSLVEQETLR